MISSERKNKHHIVPAFKRIFMESVHLISNLFTEEDLIQVQRDLSEGQKIEFKYENYEDLQASDTDEPESLTIATKSSKCLFLLSFL